MSDKPMDESLEREGYEISNAMDKCWFCFALLDQNGRCSTCCHQVEQDEFDPTDFQS